MSAGFVGRHLELALLAGVCARAQSEARPVAAIVSGIPGSGKTRLLAELRSQLPASRQLMIRGYEAGAQVPLAAAAEALRELGKVSGAGAMLDELLFAPSAKQESSLEPLRAFEAARRALLALDGLIVLIVDDLQWVDDLSLALCSYLLRSAEPEEKELALVAAGRLGGGEAAFYESMISELGPDRVTRLDLGLLGPDDGVKLIQHLAPHLGEREAAELSSRGKGSPFWLGVLARGGAPQDLANYLEVRQRGLGRDAGRVLALLAVATRPMAVSELESLMTWDHARTDQAIAELERSGLAVVHGLAINLAHDLIRASATALLSKASRREIHALLAVWLERQARGDVQLLHEALQHRRDADLDIEDLALRVLQSPRRKLLGRDGLLEIVSLADSERFTEPIRTALQLSVAQLATELGEQQLALERWTLLASTVADPTLRATGYLAASRAAVRIVDRRNEAVPLLELARAEPTDDPVLAVEIDSQHANLLQVLKGRANEGRRAAFQAADKARQLWGEPPTEITSRERDAYVAAMQVAFDAALVEEDGDALLRIANEIAQIAGDSEEGAVWAVHDRAVALMFVGRVSEAMDSARRAWAQARERILPLLMLATGSTLAKELIDIGRLDEANEVIWECLELERRVAGGMERLAMGKVGNYSIHDLRHQVWLSRGDWIEAIAGLEREVARQPEPHFRMHLHWHIFTWLARCADGRGADVDLHVAASRRDSATADCRRCSRELALKTAEAFVRLGRIDDAEELLRVWDEKDRGTHINDQLGRRQIAASIAVARGDAAGIAELEAVVAERKRLGLGGALLWTRLDLAASLAGTDRKRAAAEYREAAEEAAAVGAATEQQMAELGLRRLGVHTWRRRQAAGGESALEKLSQRERQIATLIAAGSSNPEIASRLFLSRKTVERHVSNILARTGARNRTDLARLLSSQPA